MCLIRSKLTITIPEQRHLHYPGVFIVNFWTRCSSVSYVYWEKKIKFVNREESIDKNIVKFTFCNSNFLRNLFFPFITIFQLEILAGKGQNPKLKTPNSQQNSQNPKCQVTCNNFEELFQLLFSFIKLIFTGSYMDSL